MTTLSNSTNKRVALVVFDIAGTTVKDNGEIAKAFQSALSEYGYNIPVAKINPLMGYKKTDAIKQMQQEYEPQIEKITEEFINNIHSRFLELMVDHYSNAEIMPLPHAEEVFAILKEKRIKIGLNTGFSKEITDVIIGRLGWLKDEKIDIVLSSNEVKAGRPFPYMIEEMMKRFNITDARKVIKAGDTEVDVFEGKNAGCLYSIGITTGAFTREELTAYEPSFIIDDLKEIISIIENLQ